MRGMTANAFMSGSLQPPLVVVSIARNAKLHHHVVHSNLLGISILNTTQEPLSRHFAGQLSEGVRPRFEFHCGVPVLADALASIACEVHASYPCGDHTLFVASVLHTELRDGLPLLYFTGAYGRLEVASHAQQPANVDWSFEQAPWW